MKQTNSKALIATQTPPPKPIDIPKSEQPSLPKRRGRKRVEIPDDVRQQILSLHKFYSARQISPRVQLTRKLVERVLAEHGLPPQPMQDGSKLDPFRELIEQRVSKRLTTTRILREIQQVGYQGRRTILGEHVRQLRTQLSLEPSKSVKSRFETGVAQELQVDWSPYLVTIGGRVTQIHVLGCLLAWSRKLYAYAFLNERQSTLLEGLAAAFVYFDGAAARTVVDNMATAVLARIGPGGAPLWHPRFQEFVRHYGTVPFACKVRDPNRKGKKEKSFRLLEDDFLRGSEFTSLDDLNEQLRTWLDQTPNVANQRVHGTTGRLPNEAFEVERPLLIRLPEQRFAVYEKSVRSVDQTSTLSIRGTVYSVPGALANHSVEVRMFAEHFEVLAPYGRVAMSRRYVSDAEKGRLVIDKTHYANLRHRPRSGAASERLDEAFVQRFPDLRPLVDGLTRRTKSFAPFHLRTLLQLCDRYGEHAFVAAARRAQDFRRFDALAVERILERSHPATAAEVAKAQLLAPLSGYGPAALGELDCGSMDCFASLDTATSTSPAHDSSEDNRHGS
jgi:transposase